MQDTPGVKVLSVRLPLELNQWLKHRAVDNHRSANGELIVILTSLRAKENAPTAGTVEASVQ